MNIYIKIIIIFIITLLLCRVVIHILDRKLAEKKFKLTNKCKFAVASTMCIVLGFISGIII